MKKLSLFVFLCLILVAQSASAALPFDSAQAKPSDYNLKEGDLISAIFSSDPDVYIINEQGYKRLFLNPEIFKFYGHLGGFANVKLVSPEIRDSFPTSGYLRDCEDNDPKVYGIQVDGEDKGELRWIDEPGDQVIKDDPNFFKKVFCINKKEFNWYPKKEKFKSVKEVPQYTREELKNTVPAVPAIPPASTSHPFAIPASSSHPLVSSTITPKPASGSFTPTPTPTVSTVPTFSTQPVTTNQPIITTTSNPSPTASALHTPTNTVLSPPTSVTASSTTGKINISWSGTTSKYTVYRSVDGGTYQMWYGFITNSYYDDLSVNQGSVYRYKVYGCDGGGLICSTSGAESNSITYNGGNQSCTSLGLAINNFPPYKSGYTIGVDHSVNYTWTCSPGGSASRVEMWLWKPDGSSMLMNSSSGPTQTFGLGTDTLIPGIYTLKACLNGTCPPSMGSQAVRIFEILSSSPTPTPTPTPSPTLNTVNQVDFVVTNVIATTSSIVAGNSVTVSATFYNPSSTTQSIQVTIGKGVSSTNDGTQMSITYYLSLPPGNTTQSYAFVASYGAISSKPGSPANTYYPEASISGVGNGPIYINPYDPNTTNNYLMATTAYTVTNAPTPTPTPTPTPNPSSTASPSIGFTPKTQGLATLSRNLTFGSTGNDVKQLQAFLVNEVGYSANLITGYFGSITRDAVKRLQAKYNITPALGYFGEITRHRLQALFLGQ